jgi:uncharacterized protein
MVVLVDAGPGMLPWRGLQEALPASLREGQLGEWAVYYFHEIPGETLYRDEHFLHPEPRKHVVRKHVGSTLLVVSDAGAARGTRSRAREEGVRALLADAGAHWRAVAWVNPMPRARWKGTSAERIARETRVPMFELTEDGLVEAVDVLRGAGPARRAP